MTTENQPTPLIPKTPAPPTAPAPTDEQTGTLGKPETDVSAGEAPRQMERNPLSTVGFTAIELLSRACGYPRGWQAGVPRWSAVADVFHVGATTATTLCHALQIDPHERNVTDE